MPRAVIYLPSDLDNEIDNIITAEKARGATKNDVNKSSFISELIRLGLMVYKAQKEDKKEVFNIEAFRKSMLRHAAHVDFSTDVVLSVLLEMHAKLVSGRTDEEEINDYIQGTMASISDATEERLGEHFSEINDEE